MLAVPPISKFMSRPVVVVEPELAVSELMEISARRGINHFPVVDQGSLLGLVCTCDLRDVAPDTAVAKLVRRPPVCVTETSSISDTARAMAENAVGSAIVVDARGVLGIVTRADLASAGSELAAWLAEGHCACCGTTEHLRPGLDGAFLCVDCQERGRADDWFEAGDGD
jgi:CBS domain-containing protein